MNPYDPKLREAMEEFRATCRKYDCMGTVLLVSPTHAEFGNELTPSWSVMRKEGDNGIRFRSKLDDYRSREAQHAAMESTVHGVTSIINWTRQQHKAWTGILGQLRSHMKVFFTVWDKPDSVPGDGK